MHIHEDIRVKSLKIDAIYVCNSEEYLVMVR